MHPRLPNPERLVRQVTFRPFSFTLSELSECHQRQWYRYPEDQFFRFLAIRKLVQEMWQDIECEAPSTLMSMATMTDGHIETFVYVCAQTSVSVFLQDNYSMLVKQNLSMVKSFRSMDEAIKLIAWYRRRAQERGFQALALALRAVCKCLLNLSGHPMIRVTPESSKVLAIQVVWSDEPHREAITMTIADQAERSIPDRIF